MTAVRRFSEAQLGEIKARNPCDVVAGQWVTLRRHGRGFIGPCPLHSKDRQARDSTSFEVFADRESWACCVCCEGGDAFRLVQIVNQVDFVAAVEILGGVRELSPEDSARIEAERQAKQAKRDADSATFRDRERRTLWDIWCHAKRDLSWTPVEAYLRGRGLSVLPPGLRLRCAPDMPFYAQVKDQRQPIVIHRAPAMVAPLIGPDARFAGVQLVYLDAATAKGKVSLTHPETGAPMDARKSRGSTKGARIELVRCEQPTRLFIGEGTETVLSVWLALTKLGRDLAGAAFWVAIDLGNLGGRAVETIAHPTLKSAAGRALRVPGPRPDLSSPGIPIPDTVTEVVILGDGDSDPFTTQCAVARAATRFARDGRVVRAAFAPDGQDFNDLLRVAA